MPEIINLVLYSWTKLTPSAAAGNLYINISVSKKSWILGNPQRMRLQRRLYGIKLAVNDFLQQTTCSFTKSLQSHPLWILSNPVYDDEDGLFISALVHGRIQDRIF